MKSFDTGIPFEKRSFNTKFAFEADQPTKLIVVDDFLPSERVDAIKKDFDIRLEQGLLTSGHPGQFIRSNARAKPEAESYSAYIAALPSVLPSAYDVFASCELQSFLQNKFSAKLSDDVYIALHHHPVDSPLAYIHSDYEAVNFKRNPTSKALNCHPNTCGYQGQIFRKVPGIYTTTRSVALIYYFGNENWKPGDGGETCLYQSLKGPILQTVQPKHNRLMAFEITPESWHCYAGKNRMPRNSVILWYHSSVTDQFKKYYILPSYASYDDINLKQLSENEAAEADIQRKYEDTVSFLTQLKANETPHLNGSLLNHLTNVYKILKQWQLPEHVCLAGLIHSVMGTEYFRKAILPQEKANELKSIVGVHAFNLARYYAVHQEKELMILASRKLRSFQLTNFRTQKPMRLRYQQVVELFVIAAANNIEQRPNWGNRDYLKDSILRSRRFLGNQLFLKVSRPFLSDRSIFSHPQKREFKVVAISGINTTLGRKLAKIFLKNKVRVLGIGKTSEVDPDLTADEKKYLELAPVDFSRPETIESLSIDPQLPIDLMINCAGAFPDRKKNMTDINIHDFENALRVNAIAPYFLIKTLLPHLKKSRSPLVVNINSYLALKKSGRVRGMYASKLSKAAQDMLTSAMAKDFSQITFVNIVPDFTQVTLQTAEQIYSHCQHAYFTHSGKTYDQNGYRLFTE